MTARFIDRSFAGDPSGLLPPVTPDNAPFWTALQDGHLAFQACTACRRLRYPITPVCPYCGATGAQWSRSAGRGQLFSWVRYRRSYLPEFEALMPYVVADVQLDEGPRMFGLLYAESEPHIGARLQLVIERWPGGRCVAAFEAARGEPS